MEKLKHSRIGTISFLLSFIPIIYMIIETIVDVVRPRPIYMDFDKNMAVSYIIMNFMFAISLVSMVLGIVAITQKGYRKRFPICSVIISGLVLLIPLISSIKTLIKIYNM